MEEKESLDLLKFIVKKRIFFGYIVAVLFLIFSNPTKGSILYGLIFCIAGEIIRTLSSGTIMKNKALTTSGPYGYVRNPLYLGSFLIGIGVCIMGNILMFLAAFIPLFLIIYTEIIKKEEVKLRGIFKEDFDEYVENVPRLFPRFTPWKAGKMNFELRLIKVHREYQAWLGIYAMTIIMFLKI